MYRSIVDIFIDVNVDNDEFFDSDDDLSSLMNREEYIRDWILVVKYEYASSIWINPNDSILIVISNWILVKTELLRLL